jgi:hypothetical protein
MFILHLWNMRSRRIRTDWGHIAHECGKSESSVRAIAAELRDLGLLVWTPRCGFIRFDWSRLCARLDAAMPERPARIPERECRIPGAPISNEREDRERVAVAAPPAAPIQSVIIPDAEPAPAEYPPELVPAVDALCADPRWGEGRDATARLLLGLIGPRPLFDPALAVIKFLAYHQERTLTRYMLALWVQIERPDPAWVKRHRHRRLPTTRPDVIHGTTSDAAMPADFIARHRERLARGGLAVQ